MNPPQRHPLAKIFTYFAFVGIAIGILLVVLISYLTLTPKPVLTVVNTPLPVMPPTVSAGQVINSTFNYCKSRDLTSHITIDLVGDYIVPQLSSTRHFPVGCHTRDLALVVPVSTPTGDYYLHYSITYDVNSLHRETYEFNSGKFHVNGVIQ